MTTLSLTDHKKKKKYKKIIEDIDNILKVMALSQKSLSFYKQYLPVQEMISILETNKTLLELHRSKYETSLNELLNKDKKEEQ